MVTTQLLLLKKSLYMNAVYIKPAVSKIFLEILYIAYISDFPPPNDSESIPGGLLVKKAWKNVLETQIR